MVKPHVFYPEADEQAGLAEKCVDLLEMSLGAKTNASKNKGGDGDGRVSFQTQLEACRRVNGAGGEREREREREEVWAVHHWSHTWILTKSKV